MYEIFFFFILIEIIGTWKVSRDNCEEILIIKFYIYY